MTLKRNNPVHIQSDSISCCAVEAPGYNTTTACTMAIDGTSPGKKTRREPRALGYLTHTTRAHQKNICRAQKPDSKRCCVLHADCKQREPPSYVFYGRRVVDKHCFQKDRISCQGAAEDSTGYPSVEEDPSENVDRADIGRTGRIQICMLRIRGDTTSRSLLFLRRLRRASVPLRVEALYLFALEPDVQRPLVRVEAGVLDRQDPSLVVPGIVVRVPPPRGRHEHAARRPLGDHRVHDVALRVEVPADLRVHLPVHAADDGKVQRDGVVLVGRLVRVRREHVQQRPHRRGQGLALRVEVP